LTRDLRSIDIPLGQHFTVVGSTGTGKTFLAINGILPKFQRIIVIDSEEGYDFGDFPRVSPNRAVALSKSEYAFFVRVELESEEEVEKFAAELLKHGHDLVLWIDEITDWADARRVPPELRKLIRKGRKRGISVGVSTQRPAMLSKDYLANSQHCFWMYMRPYDAAAMREYAPWAELRMDEIPFRSWCSIYEAPDGKLYVVEPVTSYSWARRRGAHK
jgi:DNA helicase HerA-like ATPase